MQRILVIFAIMALFVSFNINLNDAVVFKLTNLVCESFNQSWVVINYCRLKVLQRNRIGAFCNATVLHPAYNIIVHGRLFKRANGYKPWLLNMRVDGCQYMRRPNNPTAKVVADLLLDFTNFNHTCPYNGSQIVDGFYLRPELLKLPFPTGDYKLAIGWYFHKKLQFETNASFTFVENIIDQ